MSPDRLGTIESDVRNIQSLVVTQVIGQLAVIIDAQKRHAEYQLTCDAERKALEIRMVKVEDSVAEIEQDRAKEETNNQSIISNRTALIFNLVTWIIGVAAIFFGVHHG